MGVGVGVGVDVGTGVGAGVGVGMGVGTAVGVGVEVVLGQSGHLFQFSPGSHMPLLLHVAPGGFLPGAYRMKMIL